MKTRLLRIQTTETQCSVVHKRVCTWYHIFGEVICNMTALATGEGVEVEIYEISLGN